MSEQEEKTSSESMSSERECCSCCCQDGRCENCRCVLPLDELASVLRRLADSLVGKR